jgi:hypothetical protein
MEADDTIPDNVDVITDIDMIEDILDEKSAIVNKEIAATVKEEIAEQTLEPTVEPTREPIPGTDIPDMKGGHFLLHNNPKEVFFHFIENSNISLMRKIDSSKAGIVFRCTLKNEIPKANMNYWNLNSKSIIEQGGLVKVNSLCVKVAFCSEKRENNVYLKKNDTIYKKWTASKKNLTDEVLTQNIAAKRTNNDFDSVSPYIVFFNNFEVFDEVADRDRTGQVRLTVSTNATQRNDVNQFLNIMYENGDRDCKNAVTMIRTAKYSDIKLDRSNDVITPKLFNAMMPARLDPKYEQDRHPNLDETSNLSYVSLSVIVMENVVNSRESHDYYLNTQNQRYLCMYLHELIRCTINTGIVHSDLHMGNVLYLPKCPYYKTASEYSNPLNGRLQIIDFGQINPLTKDEWDSLLFENNRLRDAKGFEDVEIQLGEDRQNRGQRTLVNYAEILKKILNCVRGRNTRRFIIEFMLRLVENEDFDEVSTINEQNELFHYYFITGGRDLIRRSALIVNMKLYYVFMCRQLFVQELEQGNYKDQVIDRNNVIRMKQLMQKLNAKDLAAMNASYAPIIRSVNAPRNSWFRRFLDVITLCTRPSIDDVVTTTPQDTAALFEQAAGKRTIRKPGNHRHKTRRHRKKRRTQKRN